MNPKPIYAAPANTPCGWTHYGQPCSNGRPAIHVLVETLPVAPAGTALCAWHSPFDSDAPVLPAPAAAPQVEPRPYRGHIADVLVAQVAESGTEAWSEVAVSAPCRSGRLAELAIPHPGPGGGTLAVLDKAQAAALIASLEGAGRELGWWA